MQGDDIIVEAGKPYAPPPKIPVWITWSESRDSTWAQAEVIYGNTCDTIEFARFPITMRMVFEIV